MEIKKGMFMLGGEVYHGYTTGQTWNGWEWPLLPETETMRFLNDYCRQANDVNDLGEDEGAFWEKHLDDSYELWDTAEDKENHIVGFTAQGRDYTYNGETIHLYDCGCTYCWEEVIEPAYRAQSDIVKKMP